MAQVWYTQWKGNRPEDSGPIECEEFKEVFLDKYFSREMRSLSFSSNQHDVEECSMKFSKWSKYATPLVSNPRGGITRFVTGVADLVMEE